MKKIIILLLNICLCIIVGTTSIYAWYTNYFGIKTDDDILLSSNSSYYDSGTGTEADPYIISEARHLYNLAWLQDLGFYDDLDPTTQEVKDPFYFKLKNDIDMKDLTRNGVQSPIPPIGIDGHKFISNFDGSGFTINNLIISTDFSNTDYIKPDTFILNAHTTDTISGNTIITTGVGTFGVVATLNITNETGEVTKSLGVSNFILNKSKINNTKETANVGIVCGKVEGNINKVGVGYSAISSSATLASKYSLVGAIDEGIKDELSGAGGDLIIDAGTSKTDLAPNGTVVDINENAKYCGYFKAADYTTPGYISVQGESHVYTSDEFGKLSDNTYTNYVNIYNKYKDGSSFVARFESNNYDATFTTTEKGINYIYPQSGIWFKGVSNGTATIYAIGNDKSGTEVFSIYKLNVITSEDGKTITYSNDPTKGAIETTFTIHNTSGRTGAFFNFQVEKGSFYFIGKTSNPGASTSRPKFVYFILPVGTDGFNGGINSIEFVDVNNFEVPGLAESYVPFKVYATLAGSGEIWFVRKVDKLYYYNSNFTVSNTTATETTNKPDVSTEGWGPPS